MTKVLEALVISWIKKSTAESSFPLDIDEATKLFMGWLAQGVEFHSPDWRMKTFHVKVGTSRLRARTAMVLHPHSLQFNLWEPRRPILVPDIMPEYKKWYDFRDKMYRSDLSNSNPVRGRLQLSLHPHISPDGSPCLGHFGAPWSVAVNETNLMALVNVAQSFLNNWTRADCYWDINNYHRSWRDDMFCNIPKFKDYLFIRKISEAISYDNRDSGNSYNFRGFRRWFSNIREEAEGLHQSWESMLFAYLSFRKNINLVMDTDDRLVAKLKVTCDKINRMYRSLLSTILDRGWTKINMDLYPVVEGILSGKEYEGVFKQYDSIFSISQAMEDIDYQLGNFRHDSDMNEPTLFSALEAKKKVINTIAGYNIPTTDINMTVAQVDNILGRYVSGSVQQSRPLSSQMAKILHFFDLIKEFGESEKTEGMQSVNPPQIFGDWLTLWNNTDIDPRSRRETYGAQFRSLLLQTNSALLHYSVSDITAIYLPKIEVECYVVLLEEIKSLYEGAGNELSKRRTIAYGDTTRQDSGESQLSINTF